MEKKIKSVKLKNDYRNDNWVIKKGTVGRYNLLNEIYYFESDFGIKGFFVNHILNNKTELFEIEYEPERKFIDVRIEYDNLEGTFGGLNMEVENIGSTLRNMFRPDFNFKVTKL